MLYDISPAIDARLHVWPGDTAPSREVLLDIARGDNLTLSTLRSTVHLGAHADAPSHYGPDAPTIERCDPAIYLGPCRVVHVDAAAGARIGPEALDGPPGEPRVLFRTGTFRARGEPFRRDFAALAPRLIERLSRDGVRLVGIDTPSVDSFDSKDLPTHQACLRHDVAILEGLVLDAVPAGRYELIALPLKLVGFDASPVRAVLRDLSDVGERD